MDTLQKAAIHLSKDPVLAAVIAVAPLPNLKPHTYRHGSTTRNRYKLRQGSLPA
ncbi:hypothetical protein KC976_02190 [Candidatus Saccharibacteria bacterium]|nr:hypothetical protein [Candidatus Saccharibacteria bacterium]HPG37356.1 hypothetical protein [Candidatus Saccharibacteria bacterium]